MTATDTRITEPGVYDIPADVYHADPVEGGSLSSSGAKLLLSPSCPAKFRYAADHGEIHKRHFDFGHAAHREVLGTGADLVVVEAKDWRTNAAKQQRDEAYAAAKTPILAAEHEVVKAMAAAIRAHPLASKLLSPEYVMPERTLVWWDKDAGIWCRAMLDGLPLPSDRRMIIPDYKGLALNTAIPTVDGWTTMGELSVGDRLFDSGGRQCTVTAKSEVHYRTCYRIRFDDGSSVICDDEHLWATEHGRGGRYPRKHGVLTTEQIRSTLRLYGQCSHRVTIAGALDLPDADLPIDPYVLGCWLGDGTAREGRISKPDTELFDRIAACGYRISEPRPEERCPTRTIYGLRKQLRLAGLLGHKMIPTRYLRASQAQRLALLRGLMDTDGSWNRARRQAVFSNTDKALSEAVRELACSLGQRAVMHEAEAHGFGRDVTVHPVTFTPIGGLNPFSLSRKADLVTWEGAVKSERRLIIAVDKIPTVPTQCITVDSPDCTYLCTEAMIPTHNTAASVEPRALSKALHEYGYHCQAPWYVDGVRTLELDEDPAFVFVVQEKEPPYLITIIYPDDEALEIGKQRNRKARHVYARCKATDTWPGYAVDVISIGLPPWAVSQHEAAWLRGDYDIEEHT